MDPLEGGIVEVAKQIINMMICMRLLCGQFLAFSNCSDEPVLYLYNSIG